jgi:hypothetical protein
LDIIAQNKNKTLGFDLSKTSKLDFDFLLLPSSFQKTLTDYIVTQIENCHGLKSLTLQVDFLSWCSVIYKFDLKDLQQLTFVPKESTSEPINVQRIFPHDSETHNLLHARLNCTNDLDRVFLSTQYLKSETADSLKHFTNSIIHNFSGIQAIYFCTGDQKYDLYSMCKLIR